MGGQINGTLAGSGPIWLDKMACTGEERRCRSSMWLAGLDIYQHPALSDVGAPDFRICYIKRNWCSHLLL